MVPGALAVATGERAYCIRVLRGSGALRTPQRRGRGQADDEDEELQRVLERRRVVK